MSSSESAICLIAFFWAAICLAAIDRLKNSFEKAPSTKFRQEYLHDLPLVHYQILEMVDGIRTRISCFRGNVFLTGSRSVIQMYQRKRSTKFPNVKFRALLIELQNDHFHSRSTSGFPACCLLDRKSVRRFAWNFKLNRFSILNVNFWALCDFIASQNWKPSAPTDAHESVSEGIESLVPTHLITRKWSAR